MFKKRSHSISGPSPSGLVVMEGSLEKKKTFGMNRFHCTLRDGKLWYSEDKGRENLIDISRAQSVREGKAKLSFEIITSSRTHVFIADSQASRDKWMSCLHEVMRSSARKMSVQAYIETDEDGASTNTRSSVVTNSPMDSTPKPGVIPTLITRTPVKSFENEGFSDAAKLLVGTSDADFKPQNGDGSVAEKSEREETSETQKDDDTDISVETNIAEDLNLENKVRCQTSKGDDISKLQAEDMNNYKSVLRSENYYFQAKELTVASDGREETDDPSKKYPPLNEDMRDSVTVHTSSSLYANNADIKRFLSEQKNGVSGSSAELECSLEPSRPNSSETVTVVPSDVLLLSSPNPDDVIVVHATSSLYANKEDIRNFLCEQKDRVEPNGQSEINRPVIIPERLESSRSGSDMETSPRISEFPEECGSEDVNEDCDQVFPLGGDNLEVIESSKPLMAVQLRSRSGSIGSIQMEDSAVVPEPVEVELEADFVPTPIPDLPHPRLDSNRSSAFADILSFLSEKTRSDSFGAKQQQQPAGCAVECLKHFLHTLNDI